MPKAYAGKISTNIIINGIELKVNTYNEYFGGANIGIHAKFDVNGECYDLIEYHGMFLKSFYSIMDEENTIEMLIKLPKQVNLEKCSILVMDTDKTLICPECKAITKKNSHYESILRTRNNTNRLTGNKEFEDMCSFCNYTKEKK